MPSYRSPLVRQSLAGFFVFPLYSLATGQPLYFRGAQPPSPIFRGKLRLILLSLPLISSYFNITFASLPRQWEDSPSYVQTGPCLGITIEILLAEQSAFSFLCFIRIDVSVSDQPDRSIIYKWFWVCVFL